MRKEHLNHSMPVTRSTQSELPDDLSHPPDPQHRSLIANVIAATTLGVATLALLAYALLVVQW